MSDVALESVPPPAPALEVVSDRPRTGLIVALVAVLAVAAMSASSTGGFVYDDIPLIEGNARVHGFEHWTRWFTGTLWDSNYDPSLAREMRDFWRPLVLASYAVNWVIGGGDPLVFHLTNLLVHALNASLSMYLLLGWVGGAVWPAAIGALLFAVHPVQTEPVAWIAGRTDSLCALGLLVATLGIRVARSERVAGILLQALGVLVAFGSKEAAVVLPVLAALELWSEHRPPLTASTVGHVLCRVWPYLLVALAYVVINRLLIASPTPDLGLTASNHPLLVLEAVGRYSALLLWPDDLTLGRAQLRVEGNAIAPSLPYAAAGALSLGLMLVVAWRARLRWPALSLGLLAYAAMLLPVSGAIWLGTGALVSPRFLYEPMLAVALVVATLSASWPRPRALASGLCAALIVCLAARSFVRAGDFESEEAFWRREILHNPSYSPAQEYYVYREIGAGRPRAALTLASGWLERIDTERRPGVARGRLVIAIAAAALQATPDLDTASLEVVQRFAEQLSRGAPGSLRLPALGLEVDVGSQGGPLASFRKHEQRLLMIAAEAAVRRGDDAVAVALADRALAACDDCWRLLSNSALILARARQFERAQVLAERALANAPPDEIRDLVSIIDGARRWEKMRGGAPSAVIDAGLYSALGSFGRAHRAARPAIDNPPAEPAAVVSLAELAFRAGDVPSAQRLLARVLPPQGVQERLAALERSVTWLDQPRGADEWLPGG